LEKPDGRINAEMTDGLSPAAILQHIEDSGPIRWEPKVFPVLPSTNDRIKELAAAGAAEGTVILCETQTAGRGRLDRSFFSPEGTGLYMSLLLRPSQSAGRLALLTPLAAVAVCESVRTLCRPEAGIKWVNDILIGGKKVCGILAEAFFSAEGGRAAYAVVGIGVNVYEPVGGFPPGLEDKAAALLPERRPGLRAHLAAEILNRLQSYYQDFAAGTFLQRYRALSVVIGREIGVSENGSYYRARALDIDDAGALVIRTENGAVRTLTTGEIRL
jgi:BirA family biotin operon repressor/biotin-[acetyl-CoA-carboxylase] ligase